MCIRDRSKGYFKEVGKYAAKDIEYDMQQDGVFNTVSVFAYPSEEQSKDKCIDALDHVHMDPVSYTHLADHKLILLMI